MSVRAHRADSGYLWPVIIWLNGGFGAGKTTLAGELRRRVPGAVVYDPEGVGAMLWKWLPRNDDFQDLPSWRELVVATAVSLRRHHAATLIVPMSLIREAFARLPGATPVPRPCGRAIAEWTRRMRRSAATQRRRRAEEHGVAGHRPRAYRRRSASGQRRPRRAPRSADRDPAWPSTPAHTPGPRDDRTESRPHSSMPGLRLEPTSGMQNSSGDRAFDAVAAPRPTSKNGTAER